MLIARALAAEPQLLLLDEPTAGVDPGAAAAIMDVVGRLNRDSGLTVLLVTHQLRMLRPLARSVVWVAGRKRRTRPGRRDARARSASPPRSGAIGAA